MSTLLERYLSWWIYPLVILTGVVSYLGLQSQYPGKIWIAYLPALLATLIVIALERLLPAHRAWRPNRRDIQTDAVFMVVVQVILPLTLGMGVVSLLHAPMSDWTQRVGGIWPHHWPLLLQASLMLIAAEFINYWVHRLAHTLPWLWRFHAVHHSPQKLYWLNVGRFHPVEKIWQYALITLPFILLGVAQDVIGLYFVFYAINGFFQHANIKLKYGWLNYLVSSAELHRWHHSPVSKESNHNYGNNLIIWDLVFGSWFLPTTRTIQQVGSGIVYYPQGFLSLMFKPFQLGSNTLLVWVIFKYLGWRYWRRFINNSITPGKVQQHTLKTILGKNQHTQFGQQYDFADITNHVELMQKVPISGYEDIEGLIKQQEATGRELLHYQATVFYARTSGTTGRPKDIPITRHALQRFKQQQRLLSYYQYQMCPQGFAGKALGIVSPMVEGQTDFGHNYGSVSGYIYKTMPRLVRDRYLVPAAVFDITDYELKYRIIIRLALAQTNITYLGAANPSTFLRLRDIINRDWPLLLDSLKTGGLPGVETLCADLQTTLKPYLRPEPERYQVLQQLSGSSEIEFKDLWPSIRMIATWTGGNCRIAMQRLQDSLPASVHVVELGYIATEFRATLTCDPQTNGGLPLLDQMYYEFIERHDWENGVRETLTIEQLQPGRAYYIIVSTEYGLYRYFINDLVEVCGMKNNTPLIRFLQKGKGVTNITGEKLYETQVNRAIECVCNQHELKIFFHIALANSVKARYQLYLELEETESINKYILASEIDKALAENNIEYALKRKSGRLRAPQVNFLARGCSEAYKLHQINLGQREGQFKLVTLQDKNEFSFEISKYVIEHEQGNDHVSSF